MWFDETGSIRGRLFDYIPKSDRGSVIFTSRDKKACVKFAGHAVMEITEVDEEGSIELLENYLIKKELLEKHDDAKALVSRLTCLPLAIVEAAAYINSNSLDLRSYMSLMEEKEDDEIHLLSEDFEDRGRYRDTKNPVATTWLISFRDIRQRDSLAAEYLSFMACIDYKDIPIAMLPPAQSSTQQVDSLGTLRGYSFIFMQAGGLTLTLHRLVHLAMRNWLQKEGYLPEWSGKAVSRIASLIRKADKVERAEWRSYLPHASHALEMNAASPDKDCVTLRRAHQATREGLRNRGRMFFSTIALPGKSEPDRRAEWRSRTPRVFSSLISKLIDGDEDELDDKDKYPEKHHPTTLISLRNLAIIFIQKGRLDEAEQLQQRVLDINIKILGEHHPHTLSSMNSLASIFENQGRIDEAEQLRQNTRSSEEKAGG